MMGNEYIESIVWLQQQILHILRSTPTTLPVELVTTHEMVMTMNASKLRGWLYSYYAYTKQWQLYEGVHARANYRNKRRRLDLDPLSIAYREELFDDSEST